MSVARIDGLQMSLPVQTVQQIRLGSRVCLAIGFDFGIYEVESGHLGQFCNGFADLFFRFGQFVSTNFH